MVWILGTFMYVCNMCKVHKWNKSKFHWYDSLLKDIVIFSNKFKRKRFLLLLYY